MLFLVVGASGAGKDTLMDAAQAMLPSPTPGSTALAGDEGRFRFVQRVITRPLEAGGERHDAVTDAEFTRREEAGAFALSWRAHGLRYGIPADIADTLHAGHAVVANVSRAVVAEAAARFPTRMIEVTAPTDVLARRLAARGREDAVDVARRMSRAIELPSPVPRDMVMNDGTVESGARRLLAILREHAPPPRPTPGGGG